MDEAILGELKMLIDSGVASGALAAPVQINQEISLFRERFGPDVLGSVDGEALLRLMHGRQDGEPRCMAYWLEFKNDEEFEGHRFGGIAGGSALKFGVFQRQNDGAWITGAPNSQRVIPLAEAIEIARRQRAELVNGAQVLAALSTTDASDAAYSALQADMEKAAPKLSGDGWAHKYWFLIHPDRIDDYHSPRYQRFHLLKLLQMPPDNVGILSGTAPRFVCAGRFISAARDLSVPVTTLNRVLNRRDGAFHRYWKVGTTEGDSGASHWDEMREGGFVSIGWAKQVGDLSETIGLDKSAAKNRIRDLLLSTYSTPAVALRKAGEILNFALEIAETDLVLACEGQSVLGVGRIRGPYEFVSRLGFPHTRPVEWLLLDPWKMPDVEGPRTTVYEIGRSANNLLKLEQRLAARTLPTTQHKFVAAPPASALKPLDPFSARVDSILRRKGQAILYGPPGTGKTYWALEVAHELAARNAFGKSYAELAAPERSEITGNGGMVRVCTFHPGWGYEDFVEGLRPSTLGGQMVFEPRDGVFKGMCLDAAAKATRHFYLVVDEINRGDLPRIFGELMTVIELDKREREVVLPVTGLKFKVPKNISIIGTMNTADRSISLLDAALRRRFGFVELMPDSGCLGRRTVGGLPLGPWLDALNIRLRRYLKRDARNLQVGHAYLMPTQPIASVSDFARVLRDDIIPLLEEYCYDDFGVLKQILGGELVDSEAARIQEDLFAAHREGDLILALSFEEMSGLVLAEGVPGEDVDALVDDTEEVDADDAPPG